MDKKTQNRSAAYS